MRYLFVIVALVALPLQSIPAQQNPYFVTYDHRMEEHQNLEFSTQSTYEWNGFGQKVARMFRPGN